MADCIHAFVNLTYAENGDVSAKCASCGEKVVRKHHKEMAKIYKHES